MNTHFHFTGYYPLHHGVKGTVEVEMLGDFIFQAEYQKFEEQPVIRDTKLSKLVITEDRLDVKNSLIYHDGIGYRNEPSTPLEEQLEEKSIRVIERVGRMNGFVE